MRNLQRRVDALESAAGVGLRPWHKILLEPDQSYEEAFAQYRTANPDEVFEPDHNILWRMIVEPNRDASGRIRPPEADTRVAPDLADLLGSEA